MNQRRMFSPKIVGSDAFLEMPVSARELYFQLGMYADDDGFINPKKIVKMISAADDDLKMLIAKRFVLPFENGVVVIKHWLINNLVRKDFYRETIYLDEKKLLGIKENKAYTDNVNKLLTSSEHRIGKDRIGKDISSEADLAYIPLEEEKKKSSAKKEKKLEPPWDSSAYIDNLSNAKREDLRIMGHYMKIKKMQFPTKKAAEREFGRNIKAANELSEYPKEKRKRAVSLASQRTKEWTLLTCVKYLNK